MTRQKKKKNLGSEYYDLTDPFIDDSELAIDERTFIAQMKQQGPIRKNLLRYFRKIMIG